MHIKNSVLSVAVAALWIATVADSVAQSAPALYISTRCLHTNEELFLIGTNLIPGERITGYMEEYEKNGPYIFYADTNGNLRANITRREWVYTDGPPISLPYEFDSWQSKARVETNVWYQTLNGSTNQWNYRNIKLAFTPAGEGGYPYSGITVTADINPFNNEYRVQMATNMNGPWTFIGPEGPEGNGHDYGYDLPSTNSISYGFGVIYMSSWPPNAFFRLKDPQGPCPCEFTATNSP